MSYSNLRGCWFSEMPQVRCHVHRSPGSKLRPLCFSPDMPPSSFSLSLSISSHAKTRFHVTLFTPVFLYSLCSMQRCFLSSIRANKVISVLFIISNNRAISQVSIWTAVLYESHPVLAVWVREEARERSFNHLRAPASPVGGRERVHCAEITRSGRQRGVNNNAIVSEMTEVRSFLCVCRPHRRMIKAGNISKSAISKLERWVIWWTPNTPIANALLWFPTIYTVGGCINAVLIKIITDML